VVHSERSPGESRALGIHGATAATAAALSAHVFWAGNLSSSVPSSSGDTRAAFGREGREQEVSLKLQVPC